MYLLILAFLLLKEIVAFEHATSQLCQQLGWLAHSLSHFLPMS